MEATISLDVDELLQVVAKETGRDPATLTRQATLASLGLSSLDVLSLVFSLEDHFGVTLEPEDLDTVKTLDDLTALVRRRAGEAE